MLVRNSEDVHSTVPVMDLTMLDSESDRGSQNSVPRPHVPVGNDEGPISEVGLVLGQDAIVGESDTESLPGSVVDAEVEVEEEPLDSFPGPKTSNQSSVPGFGRMQCGHFVGMPGTRGECGGDRCESHP